MSEWTLGVDPGKRAGAALLAPDGGVYRWWTWTPAKGGWRVQRAIGEASKRESMYAVGGLLADNIPLHVGIVTVSLEAVQIQTARRVSGASVVTLAESAGELLGPLRTLGPVVRPRPADWAALVGGLGGHTERAYHRADSLVWHCARPTREDAGTLECLGALHEAIWIARWAQLQETP